MDELRVDPEEVKGRNDVVFVDARNEQAWSGAETKLPGAIRVPANALGSHLDELPKDKLLVPYCT
jgi:rhodanese-related sulfurtransferase